MDTAVEGLSGSVLEGAVRSSSIAGAGSVGGDLPVQGKEQYEEEIDALVRFFNEEERLQVVVRYRKDRDSVVNIQRKKIAFFLEGSRLPFSILVKDIYEKLSGENDQDQTKSGAVTMALVKSSVLSLGERLSFGITNPDTDVLEDDTVGSLWCWEVRDAKLFPRVFRDEILDRRRWRKKIGERIAALSATLQSAEVSAEGGEIAQAAQEALAQVDDVSAIRAAKLMWQQKKGSGISSQANPNVLQNHPLGEQSNNLTHQEAAVIKGRRRSDPEEKERLRLEKQLKRQQVENEKEQKRKDKEEADRKKQQQKQQDEAEKEQKRKEKEEGERKKQEKRQQDEAEKEQKREAERKKQLALKKQASFMDRFLVKKDQQAKEKAGCGQSQTQQHCEDQAASPSPVAAELEKRESLSPSVQAAQKTAAIAARMDVELKCCDAVVPDAEDLLRSHVIKWLSIRNQSTSRKNNSWGVRRKPKVSVYRELRLNGGTGSDSRANSQDDGHVRKSAAENSSSPASHLKRTREEFDNAEDVIDLVDECCPNSPPEEGKKSFPSSSSRYHQLRNKKRKLLQFDKSHRPPYYGTFSKKSEYIKPRHPLKQDPDLDYEVDSDEEWEEEDPGESLSDVEKDEEDEKIEIEEIEDDEDGPDEFVVPDGYLSENEGVAMEDSERGVAAAGGTSANQSPVTPPVHQNVMTMDRLRKVLDNATEHAIRSNHPFVISNLGQHPGCEEDSSSQFPSNRTETMCLEALRMCILVPNLLIGAC